jgi:predicted DNA-binding transcriptional regulator AlpA
MVKKEETVHDRLLRIKDVLKFVPLSRSTWLRGVKEGRFPEPVKVTDNVVAWRMSDIQDLIASL